MNLCSTCSARTIQWSVTRGGVEDTRLEVKAKGTKKGQGQPHLRTDPLEAKAKDTGASVLKKKVFKKRLRRSLNQKQRSSIQLFKRSPNEENKKGLRKFSARFLAFSRKTLTIQKIVLSSSRGQGNFRGLEASRLRPST